MPHRRRSLAVVPLLAILVSVAGCSTSEPGTPPSSPSAPSSSGAASTSATPEPSGSKAADTAQPLAGGVDYLHAYQRLMNARVPLFNDLNATGSSGDLSGAIAAVRRIRDVEYAFNLAVRKIHLDPSAGSDSNRVLVASGQLVAAIDRAAAASTLSVLSSRYRRVETLGARTDALEHAVMSDLSVATAHPTGHLASSGLPMETESAGATPKIFAVEKGSAARATYGGGGYQLAIAPGPGSVYESAIRPLRLSDTSVTATMTVSGDSAGAFVTCRSAGSGTNGGELYALGVQRNGTYYIQLVDPAARQSTNLATGSVAPLGPGDVVLRADCVGHYLTLFIGGNPVFQVYDDTLSAGDVGIAATADQGGLVLLTRFRATGGG